jgi:hypothetical protein
MLILGLYFLQLDLQISFASLNLKVLAGDALIPSQTLHPIYGIAARPDTGIGNVKFGRGKWDGSDVTTEKRHDCSDLLDWIWRHLH